MRNQSKNISHILLKFAVIFFIMFIVGKMYGTEQISANSLSAVSYPLTVNR